MMSSRWERRDQKRDKRQQMGKDGTSVRLLHRLGQERAQKLRDEERRRAREEHEGGSDAVQEV